VSGHRVGGFRASESTGRRRRRPARGARGPSSGNPGTTATRADRATRASGLLWRRSSPSHRVARRWRDHSGQAGAGTALLAQPSGRRAGRRLRPAPPRTAGPRRFECSASASTNFSLQPLTRPAPRDGTWCGPIPHHRSRAVFVPAVEDQSLVPSKERISITSVLGSGSQERRAAIPAGPTGAGSIDFRTGEGIKPRIWSCTGCIATAISRFPSPCRLRTASPGSLRLLRCRWCRPFRGPADPRRRCRRR